MQIGILETEIFSEKAIKELKKLGNVTFYAEDDVKKFVKDKDILFIRLKYYINVEILDNANNLKIICSPTTGLNHIDVEEVAKRNIRILSLKGENQFLRTIRATPEHFFGLTLSLLRNYRTCFISPQNSVWDRDLFRGYEIYNKNVGIIGFGRVGKLLAKYFSCFDANVFFYDINELIQEEFSAKKMDSIDDVIKNSEIILLCASYCEDNKEFIDRRAIDMMENKYFINAARGELVDEEYLLKKIVDNHFNGIAVDVIQNESEGQNRLDQFVKVSENTNFILTPHIGGATFESMWKTEEFISKKLVELYKKE